MLLADSRRAKLYGITIISSVEYVPLGNSIWSSRDDVTIASGVEGTPLANCKIPSSQGITISSGLVWWKCQEAQRNPRPPNHDGISIIWDVNELSLFNTFYGGIVGLY
jgi:hypothetical protein